MVAREVRVTATGVLPDQGLGVCELFTNESISLLVCATGGVIPLSAAVAPGQLLLITNVASKRDVVAQIRRKRAYRPTSCYVELEFAEPVEKFWGIEFSAASAFLPKGAEDTQAAAMIGAAEATEDEPGEPPASPPAEQVQAFRSQIESVRGPSQAPPAVVASQPLPEPTNEPATMPDVPAPALNAEDSSTPSTAPVGLADLASSSSFAEISHQIGREPAVPQWTEEEKAELPKPALDFSMSLPKKRRRSFRARGSFTPAFRGGILRVAVLIGLLLITIVGAAWFKNWIPWRSAGKSASAAKVVPGASGAKTAADFSNTRVASDAPITSAGMPVENTSSPTAAAAKPNDSAEGGAAAPPTAVLDSPGKSVAKKPVASTLTAKRSADHLVAKPAATVVAASQPEAAMVPPKLIKSVRAVASLDALRDFETGNVVIDAVVGTKGEVNFVSVISGPPSLREPAVESLKQYQYEPATRNGQPIPAHVTITIHFRFEP
jgi:TonB family protein